MPICFEISPSLVSSPLYLSIHPKIDEKSCASWIFIPIRSSFPPTFHIFPHPQHSPTVGPLSIGLRLIRVCSILEVDIMRPRQCREVVRNRRRRARRHRREPCATVTAVAAVATVAAVRREGKVRAVRRQGTPGIDAVHHDASGTGNGSYNRYKTVMSCSLQTYQ